MATLQECLAKLPSDMLMRDLPAPGRVTATVAELLVKYHRVEDGYEIRDEKFDYGQTLRKAVGVIGGPAIFREKS